MPRAMWSGAISFGLVNVPVKLYNAVSPKSVHFHLLHDADGVRIKQKRVCPADGEEVSSDHLVKGYEISRNRYVVVQPDELDALAARRTHTIDIVDFVPAAQIDPVYFDHPYVLVPDRGAQKAYALLLKAMERRDRIAIAKVVLRTKEYTVAIRPVERALHLETLYYSDEVVAQEAFEGLPENVEPADRELTMAEQLIDMLATDFAPEKYHDEYRERVLELIDRKAQGEEIAVQPEAEAQPKVIDLMSALEASIANARKQPAEATGQEEEEERPRRRRRA